MLMVTDSGRQNGTRERERQPKRGSRFTGNRFPLCFRRHRHLRTTTTTIVIATATTTANTNTNTVAGTANDGTTASASAFSPNFVANLRATKSAPFDFTLIRCRCRTVDEANPSFTLERGSGRLAKKKDFILCTGPLSFLSPPDLSARFYRVVCALHRSFSFGLVFAFSLALPRLFSTFAVSFFFSLSNQPTHLPSRVTQPSSRNRSRSRKVMGFAG